MLQALFLTSTAHGLLLAMINDRWLSQMEPLWCCWMEGEPTILTNTSLGGLGSTSKEWNFHPLPNSNFVSP
jgi:hypothetical protein